MPAYFLDSSALVKRYIVEIGSAWVTSLCSPLSGATLYGARIANVEVISAIARRVRSGSLSATDGATSIAQFKTDFAGGIRVIELTPTVTARAVILAETQSLRGYDAVQLASALEVNALRLALGETALIFISADAELNAAAAAEGLTVDDPNSHP